MSRLLICKDAEQSTLLESRLLQETENINYTIIENPPVIEEREGYRGYYVLEDGEVVVKYEKVGLTQKERMVLESKQSLQQWLIDNPLYSTVHNPEGEYYTVTQEKQNQLTMMIVKASISLEKGEEFECKWNSVGKECETWTYEELVQLSDEIYEYVMPQVAKQQAYEVQINSCDALEELRNIAVTYGL